MGKKTGIHKGGFWNDFYLICFIKCDCFDSLYKDEEKVTHIRNHRVLADGILFVSKLFSPLLYEL